MLIGSLLIGLTVLVSCISTGHMHQISTERIGPREGVPGELLVKFRSGVPDDRVTKLLTDMSTEVIRTFQAQRLYHLRITSGDPVDIVVRKFQALSEVEYAEPNYIRKGSQEEKNIPSP